MMEHGQRRILHFLRAGPATLGSTARPETVLLDAGERGRIAVDRNALGQLADAGALFRAGGEIRLAEIADAMDPFTARPQQVSESAIATGGETNPVAVNLNESPLAMLYRRAHRGQRFLTDPEFIAGERLRSDYERACIMPRLGANWQASASSNRRSSAEAGMVELTDAILAARQRVDHAIRAVGPELAGVLIDICCFLKGVETVETERRWPARSAKVVLKAALGALSRHYEPPRRRGPVLHWGDAGYRPSMRNEDAATKRSGSAPHAPPP